MKNIVFAIFFISLSFEQACSNPLWEFFKNQPTANDSRGLEANWNKNDPAQFLELKLSHQSIEQQRELGLRPHHPCWHGVNISNHNQNFNSTQYISTTLKNSGDIPVTLMFWVVGANGWGASGETFIIEPGQVKTFKADLRATYPDKTPKLNPAKLKQIRWMISKPKAGQAIQILSLNTQGSVDPWVQPKVMLDLPEMTSGSPGPGKRVKVQLQEDKNNFKYFALYLPTNWQPNKSYPVIFEYPGNIFYSTKACYSSGRPESCTMGYGISQGKDSIWVSMPFIDQDSQTIAENGFGSNEGKDTINYSLKVIDLVCQQWNGDRNNLFICGFSRGSIACGYIGLSNDKIAAHWKGIIGCQHYDGSRWNQSNMKGAILRAPRFKGKAIFQVDNQKEKYQPVVDATSSKVGWTFTKSGLNYHSTTMFLDDRPMMQQLRRWYYSIRQ